jgi:hypothetical protein
MDFLLLELWTIAAALETFAEPSVHVPAAVAWFRHAGPTLVEASLHGDTFADGLGSQAPNPGFGVRRWAVWRGRMEELAQNGDRVARDGLRVMKRYDARIAAGF